MEIVRPKALTVAAILLVILGVLQAFGGAILIAFAPIVEEIAPEIEVGPAVTAAAALAVAIGILSATASIGLWRVRRWGGMLGIAISAIGIISNAITRIPSMAVLYAVILVLIAVR